MQYPWRSGRIQMKGLDIFPLVKTEVQNIFHLIKLTWTKMKLMWDERKFQSVFLLMKREVPNVILLMKRELPNIFLLMKIMIPNYNLSTTLALPLAAHRRQELRSGVQPCQCTVSLLPGGVFRAGVSLS